MQDELIRGNVKVASVGPSSSARARVTVGPPKPSDRQAEILVEKNGEQIESIVITCPCGEKITIVCDYV
ncbi:hypothetical protein [Planctomycetes bacterium K23_9]|uniref:Uncharacterized protein n=1 Tax=Stieleria marina TaxID=1930275 RepID=A0A517NT23_9BACT|nr:hypothetical protein K239x_22210 [Planctomycetes bacterium K23_9]